jgi:phage-related holin
MLTVVLFKEDSGILRCYTMPIDEVINASEKRSVFVFMVKQFYLKDEGIEILRNVDNYLPVDTVQ